MQKGHTCQQDVTLLREQILFCETNVLLWTIISLLIGDWLPSSCPFTLGVSFLVNEPFHKVYPQQTSFVNELRLLKCLTCLSLEIITKEFMYLFVYSFTALLVFDFRASPCTRQAHIYSPIPFYIF